MPDAPAPRPALDPIRLADVPAPLRVEVVEATGSTNALVAERARAGEPAGLVVVTEHQTAGRGRLDRVWETPARVALTFSVLLRPDAPPQAWPWLPLLTGYAVQSALADRVPEVSLKWPNDVLVEDRKIAGILVERIETPAGPAAVVGVGINVNQEPEELPIAAATSLRVELGETFDRTDLLIQVLGSLHALEPLLAQPSALRPAYADVCSTLGRQVDVHLPGGEVVRGEALDLDASGALVLSTGQGTLTVSAGDIVHVRPTG
ncbi:biotin--[acetyl-CoA-carboxylase] ligase [Nocardioides campestrisoli]|uniref:biotin--[acetyl-CoA-carboxylase] ligase n=1 Tax=Nocardioides campestrisoli TaxID=2736757 RepID=UPI00163DB619|nr:biotin--[acetyl-CoA-carboxylase] ligase [Nocardioides campestrisoli]